MGRTLAWIALAVALFATTAATSAAQTTPLRQTDWAAVIASTPSITVDPDCFRLPDSTLGPCVTVSGPIVDGSGLNGQPEITGYAAVQDVRYGDIDGDGDGGGEAIMPVFSGGTAGDVGFLIFREGNPQPRLVIAVPGYKVFARPENGRLVVSQPSYVGFEGNCCPSASVTQTFRLAGDRLVLLDETVEPFDQAREPTLSAYYEALNDRRFEDAWAFLSPAMQARVGPFASWRAGFDSTVRTDVDITPAAGNDLRVQISATDRTAGGGQVTRRFTGTWTLIFDPAQRRWLLDRATIMPATRA